MARAPRFRATSPKTPKREPVVLGKIQKEHVAKLREMGVEKPRQYFVQRRSQGIPWMKMKVGAAKELYRPSADAIEAASKDKDLVGSKNGVTSYGDRERGGTAPEREFVGGAGNEFSGGGGGSGSGLAGRETLEKLNVEGQSMEEVVYGATKKKKSTRRKSRGLGE